MTCPAEPVTDATAVAAPGRVPGSVSEPASGVLLAGGTANFGRVLRYGDTVHRPRGEHTPSVHALLRHLEAVGFDGSPRVVQDDPDNDAEILRFIDGAAASEPLPPWAREDQLLASVGALLRDFHEHAGGFDPTGHVWQRPVPAPWRGDLLCHNDVNPANVVFRDGRAVALIDFDLAAPGTAAWDLAITACLWIPLRDEVDLTALTASQRHERFGVLLDGYGADAALSRRVAEALIPANQWIAAIIKDNARNGHPAFTRVWARRRAVHTRAGAWLARHAYELTPRESA